MSPVLLLSANAGAQVLTSSLLGAFMRTGRRQHVAATPGLPCPLSSHIMADLRR
jgi:hypothetical protein